MTNYWLMKSEPDVYSIDHLKHDGTTKWDGVRNYQARNFMRDDMAVGDRMLFYHSNAKPPGVAGSGRISKRGIPDTSALDTSSDYYDPKASLENPIWITVEVTFVEKFAHFVSIQELKNHPELADLRVLQKGSRLSITPLTKKEFELITRLGNNSF